VRGGFRFAPPTVPEGSLLRPRLLALLQDRWQRRLTAVVAGAGFGKTTLLSQAVAENRLTPLGRDWRWVDVVGGGPERGGGLASRRTCRGRGRRAGRDLARSNGPGHRPGMERRVASVPLRPSAPNDAPRRRHRGERRLQAGLKVAISASRAVQIRLTSDLEIPEATPRPPTRSSTSRVDTPWM